MCNDTVQDFVYRSLPNERVVGRRILEVGSLDVNGSVREGVCKAGPEEYIGVDIENGQSVDVVCNALDLIDRFGAESFDVVISTEMLEHVRYWRTVVSNLKNVLRPGGTLVLTTRSMGFPYHAYPHDYWRFSCYDMGMIFADFSDVIIEEDPTEPGVFVQATRPDVFTEKNLETLALYSMVTGQPAQWLNKSEILWLRAKMFAKRKMERFDTPADRFR